MLNGVSDLFSTLLPSVYASVAEEYAENMGTDEEKTKRRRPAGLKALSQNGLALEI